MNTKKFLEAIHGFGAEIHFRGLGPSGPKTAFGTWPKVRRELKAWNASGLDVFFVVNTGGTRADEISCINAVWIDCDAGPAIFDEYAPPSCVNVYRRMKREHLSEFSCSPSIVVETRNGLHVYWLLEPGATIEQFKEAMGGLARRFAGDPKVCSPANLMRLPGFKWLKLEKRGYPPFNVRVRKTSQKRYPIADILKALPAAIEDPDQPPSERKAVELAAVEGHGTIDSQEFITEDLLDIDRPETPTPSALPSWEDALEFLKRQDSLAVVGLPVGQLRCPFHADKSPSMSIWKNSATGHFLATCHSSRCSLGTVDLIDFYSKQRDLSHYQAVMGLLKQFGQEIAEPGWMSAEKVRLTKNVSIIDGLQRTDSPYPRLRGRIAWYLPVLRTLHEECLRTLCTPKQMLATGEAAFFASLRHLEPIVSRATSVISKRIALLTHLGLVRKLPDDQVPPDLLADAHSEVARNGHHVRISFYALPTYSPEVLANAETAAGEFYRKGMSVRGLSAEMFSRADGAGVARAIYPTGNGGGGDEQSWMLARGAAERMIQEQGCFSQGQILSELGWTRESQITRLKQLLPGLMKELKLNRIQANKAIKIKFALPGNGYPIVFMPHAENEASS